jgi:hypothetical protein
MTNSNGLIFARVQSKGKAVRNNYNGWDYKLSNGATMFLPNPNLKVGSWNFFEVKMDAFKNLHYVSHCPLSVEDGKAMDTELAVLKQQANEVNQFWRKLEDHERACLMKEIGIAVAGIGAGAAALSGITAIGTAIATECALTALTGGVSLFVAAGLAGISYCQYEELKKSLAIKMQTVDVFNKKRERFATSLQKHVPTEYKSLEVFDPQVDSLVTRLKLIFDDFDFTDLFTENESGLNWYGAPA